jgi:transcriptional regulator with GAF, ATPase, and Fis domain
MTGETIVGLSAETLEICRLIGIVAQQDATVLIQGESGTGKELVAKTIHRYSRRADRPFVRVNCAALTETLLESEMFGHRKGAFTGALYSHKGRFETANRGTLLLDEIGNMSLGGQAKILRVLQEREFEPVGQSSSVRVDVRIIATTNVDLEKAVSQGQFREDLYYRLAVVPIAIPPLRQRRDDILPLAEHFLGGSLLALAKPAMTLTRDIEEILLAHRWPGNARELRNAMEYAALVALGTEIRAEHLPKSVTSGAAQRDNSIHAGLRERVKSYEREIVLDALQRARGVRKDVGKILGIDPRNVGYFLGKHGIRWPES